MSKRTLDESLGADGIAGQDDARRSKKSRKLKSTDSKDPPTTQPAAEIEGAKVRDGDIKKKSKKRKERSGISATTDAPQIESEVSERLESNGHSKEERKALRRARKLAKLAAAADTETSNADTSGTATPQGPPSKAEEKAARKAEKCRLKALKKEAKRLKASVSSSETSTPDRDTSASSSLAPSNYQSSVTTPEPLPPTSSANGPYVEDPALSAVPQAEIDAFLTSNLISITDPAANSPKYRPITSFSYLPIDDEAQRAPFASFSAPTPIQAAAWPSLFAARDVIGIAETGSGKTLAFGVPLIRHITSMPQKDRKGVKAVVVSPTRELAVQIHEQLVKLAIPAGLKAACVYGGVPKDDQRTALRTANIVVATPGRLNDLIDEGAAKLSKVRCLVLDEADRMLDKGFEDAIRKIIGATPPTADRQTLMFTATWPASVRELAASFMKAPVRITIGDNHSGELRANTRISQVVEVIDPKRKETRLLQLLKEHQSGSKRNDRILVFCLYKKEATRIENFIRSKGFKVAGIHGDLGQAQRTSSLDSFKQGKVPLLVATDVAARGLDIPAVKVVINVTFPLTAEDYVHRIGRTGRAGQDGKAVTLFTEHDKALSGALINVLKAANQPVPDDLLKFGTTVKKKTHEAYGAFYKNAGDMKAATKITFD